MSERCYECHERPTRYPDGVICRECFDRICTEEIERLAAESETRVLHCWADGPGQEVILGPDGTAYTTDTAPAAVFEGQWWGRLNRIGSTCLLPAGHEGPHEWTPDDTIAIHFKDYP